MNAALELSDKKYKAKPLRRVYIPKPGKTKTRPLSIPTMYDRAMQALYALALQPISETTSDPRSFGFRMHRSTQDVRKYGFLTIECGICSGDGQKGDIPKSPGPGLPGNIGIVKGHGIGYFL